jgi:uncharacterized UBP type Zn finger protein
MACAHLSDLSVADATTTEGCEECLAEGTQWVKLRLCMACGHVGCCDSSPRRHATAHHDATDHPVIESFEPGERWAWCYVDEEMLDDVGQELDRSYG